MAKIDQYEVQATSRRVTAVLAFPILQASLATSIANIALPALAQVFSTTFAQVQMVVIVYLGALTITVFIAGRLGDMYGLKPMLLCGLCLFTLASLLCGLAPTLGLLIGARALQGIGAAFMMTIPMALMRQTANPKQIGRAMGLLGTVSAVGTALGPALGGLLLATTGWASIFFIQVLFTIMTIFFVLIVLPGSTRRQSRAVITFWPTRHLQLIPNFIINILVAAVMMTTLVVGPFYLTLGLGIRESLVGGIMMIGPIIAIFSGIPSGRLVDSYGHNCVLIFGLVLLTTGALMLAILPQSIGSIGYIISITVLTPGYQLFQAANNTAALTNIPSTERGTASGLLNLSRNIGLIMGASLMGRLFAYGVGHENLAEATALNIANGLFITFVIAAVLMVIAIFVALIANRSKS